jgi:hypothetical protein
MFPRFFVRREEPKGFWDVCSSPSCHSYHKCAAPTTWSNIPPGVFSWNSGSRHSSRHTLTDRLNIPGFRDDAVKEYCTWQQSQVKEPLKIWPAHDKHEGRMWPHGWVQGKMIQRDLTTWAGFDFARMLASTTHIRPDFDSRHDSREAVRAPSTNIGYSSRHQATNSESWSHPSTDSVIVVGGVWRL